jgi:hypothetical protein
MPDDLNATNSGSGCGRAVALWLLETVAAFFTAWFLAGGVCLWSARLHLRLADYTCGHNIGYPFMLLFVVLWPTFVFALPVFFRRLR